MKVEEKEDDWYSISIDSSDLSPCNFTDSFTATYNISWKWINTRSKLVKWIDLFIKVLYWIRKRITR